MDIKEQLTEEFSLRAQQVENTVRLIDEGNTIPFIARYRKELTGSLDDQILRELSERLAYLRGLQKRKEEVAASIGALEKMTPEIERALADAKTLAEVEDIYRPYKPKRKTRASVARERGLEPLALAIMEQNPGFDPLGAAAAYISEENGVPDAAGALAGAQDIIAEAISDNADCRRLLRQYLMKFGVVRAAGAQEDLGVYEMYREFSEPVARIAGHRVLAIDRGEREGFLKVSVEADEAACLGILLSRFVAGENPSSAVVRAAAEDGYRRLIFPSLEREIRAALTETATEQAIKVFGVNLRHLLTQPPVKNSVTLGLDPGYRTGCKLAVVDPTGKVLETGVIYPTLGSAGRMEEAKRVTRRMIQKHGVTTIAIGNGTASHESEVFIAGLLRELDCGAAYMVVSEAGASVYSASKLAADEFPDYDVSLRSAVSIARRLQDPLAELVKIDPKAIGVGQYQHDMPKARLDEALGGVVESCVNSVGVDLNTASFALLAHVAGVNSAVAKNIVAYREENGEFSERRQLLKVPKLGKKAFEQCAGFLRVPGGKNVLDNTSVHPESYGAAKKLLELCGYTLADVAAGGIGEMRERAAKLGLAALAEQTGVGEPTLRDIIEELLKPGRDPRDELPKPLLRTDVMSLEDLKEGMILDGTVRNVIDFGCFVDVGVHEDGLVHISELCKRYVKHPSEVVKVGDIVKVMVIGVDLGRGRLSLSIKRAQQGAPAS
ncbi:RNA-binding transcriptional accessory protein [Clostridiaceae bacterium NSJ-31]|uniref:RNA-binding transcriptional accessory protein n=1 Tax=Ligaoa zhengdingensis TaxID=2763658 RepID=A0A926E0H2_9FIRM|nr:Tex family protein [Ligaoa zhengdingensis]MBC8546809.1 RNA-binding transcriptional accessory protein [Ligaoa zhengdingensis]